MTSYLETLDCSIEDFYREVRNAQHESHEEYIQYFIDCLLASADYDSFYKVMSRHGSLAKKSANIPIKAESKPTVRRQASKKGDDDDDDDKVPDSKHDSK